MLLLEYRCDAALAVVRLHRYDDNGRDKRSDLAVRRLAGARAAAAVLSAPPEALGVEPGRVVAIAARLADELPVVRAELPPGAEAVARLLDRIREL